MNLSLRQARKRTRIEATSGGGFLRTRYSEGGRLRRISPHIPNTAEGLREVERIALLVDAQIALGRLDQSEWCPKAKQSAVLTNREVMARVRLWYFRNREESDSTIFDWKNDYQSLLKRLDPERPFNRAEVLSIIKSYRPGSRQRSRAGNALSRAAKEAGDFELSREAREASRGYRASAGEASRFIPDDEAIVAFVDQLEDEWQWVIGVVAAFGLRPHESVHSTLLADPRLLQVGPNTKTGSRVALCRKPEWVERWSLNKKRLPSPLMVRNRPNSVYGGIIAKSLRREKAEFSGYALRHRYALALIQSGIKSDIIARSMGHDIRMHFSCYQRHISIHELGEIAKAISDR